MKGIVLAGGDGTRLDPLTRGISKQMLPVAGLQMVFYPLNTLLTAGVRDINIIVSLKHSQQFIDLLEPVLDRMGVSVLWGFQLEPKGLPDAFRIAKNFIGNDPVTLILGDNIFEDTDIITSSIRGFRGGGHIFLKAVSNPESLGVAVTDDDGQIKEIIEKPEEWMSNNAIPGVYIYDASVVDVAENLDPSNRGELEIVDVHNHYLKKGRLTATQLPDDTAWLDAGTHKSLAEATPIVCDRRILKNFHPELLQAIAETSSCTPEEFLKRLFE